MSQPPASHDHPSARPAGRRSREQVTRPRRVEFTLTDAELAELDAAADELRRRLP